MHIYHKSVRGIKHLMFIQEVKGASKKTSMEALNILYSVIGGVITAIISILINSYKDRKKFLCSVCGFIEELTLNRKGAYSKDYILITLKNYDNQIRFRFSKKVADSYEKLYGDIVQCVRLESDITETAIFESYNNFLQSIKFYSYRRYSK